MRETVSAIPFVLPGLVLAAIFVIYPMLLTLVLSISDYQIVRGEFTYVGLQNFIELFTDPQSRLLYAYRNNLLYAVATIPFILFFGLLLATLVNNLKKGRTFFRMSLYLPVITPWVIVGLVFTYLFNSSDRGLINYILVDVLHLADETIPWLLREWTGNLVIWLMGIWKNIGWAMIIYLAALQGIPRDYYEAAAIEGASSAVMFWKITLPLVKPTTFFILVNMLIGSFNVFLQVLLLTGGNPAGKTSTLQYLLYDKAFNLFEFGQGAAIGLITGVSVFVLTLVMNKLTKQEESE
jgi:multiple sugar transport system permease protein